MKTLHLSIIVIVISFGTYYAFAQYPAMPYSGPPNDLGDGNFLVMQTAKGSYLGGDIIEITGNAPLKSYVKIILTDPNGTTSDSTTTFSDRNGYFTAQLKMPKDAFGGIWKIVGTSGIYQRELDIDVFAADEVHTTHCCMKTNYTNPVVLESPLKQFRSGIAADNVKCQQDLQLVIKSEDGSPTCVKPQTAQKLVERGWGWAMQTMDSLKPLLPNRIIGLENDTGVVTFGNQTYYFETPHYTQDAYVNPMQISFHDVLFTLFPSGFKGGLPTDFGGVAANGCSGSYFWADAKFPDGTHVLLNIFALTTMSQQCSALPIHTYFSNHTNPQAGLTFYEGKMKLLVSTNNQASSALRLYLSANPPIIQSGQKIGIDISLNNTSFESLTLTVQDQDHWLRSDLSLGSCSNLPVGIAILKGYYTEQNITGASSLWLYPNIPCPAPPLGIKSYTFQPLSDVATRECSPTFSCHDSIAMEGHLAISGYWGGDDHIILFQPDNYTIVGGDEWGHIAIQHFTVTNSTR